MNENEKTSESLEAGDLVQNVGRPGVWRLVEVAGAQAVLEPWDDQAAAGCHVSEAYSIRVHVSLLRPLRLGTATRQHAVC